MTIEQTREKAGIAYAKWLPKTHPEVIENEDKYEEYSNGLVEGWFGGYEQATQELQQELEHKRIAIKTRKARVKELEKEKCELLGIIQGKDKAIQELEKEAEEYIKEHSFFDEEGGVLSFDVGGKTIFEDGAEFGYNKANEWHDIKEIEPSKEQLGKQLLIKMESVTGDTDYVYIVYKYNGESMSDVIGVIAWKEIVLPELKENE